MTSQGRICSFVQVRGSIPVYWRQPINMRYKPPLVFSDSTEHSQNVFRLHFADLQGEFGKPVVAVNLVDSHGFEGRLAAVFAKFARHPFAEDLGLSYLHFDYHSLVHGKAQAGNKLEALNRMIFPQLEAISWFEVSDDQLTRKQCGIVRTNCIDCLDRTNVTQSSIARLVLTRQLTFLGILIEGEHIADRVPQLLNVFRNLWADNGDALSRQYSGTGALKTDVTRTGKRTLQGILSDGYNSLLRYYRNNFVDGSTQDAMDLFFGKFESNGVPVYRMSRQSLLSVTSWILLGLAFAVASIFMAYNVVYPRFFSRLLWLAALLALLTALNVAIDRFGVHFVQYPKLLPSPLVDVGSQRRSTFPDDEAELIQPRPHDI
jgi:hypothetical protein